MSVTAQDSSAITATITLGSSTTATGGSNSGSGTGVAGAVSLNDVQGGATASLTHTTLSTTGGNVLVQAKEMATLTATTTSEVTAGSTSTPTTTAGSTTKSPLALNGLIGTNLVQSAASATLASSQVTTTGTGGGGVTVDAENTAKLTAMTTNAATASSSTSGGVGGGGSGSGNTALGVTLAFNTIGWKSENVLFSAIDALLGDSLLAGAFSGENPSNATATMLDTTVNASGHLTVSALSGATLSATISNTRTASTTSGNNLGEKGGQNLSLGLVLASNKVLASATASIDFDTKNLPGQTITAAGGVAVTAQDSAGIASTVTLGSSSTGALGGNTAVAGAVTLNDVRGGANASIGHATQTAAGGVVLVKAKEAATISATTTSELTATAPTSNAISGPSSSNTLAAGGLIGTNLVQSGASATLSNSVVTTSGTGSGAGGVTVDAENTASLTATTTNAATTTSSASTGGNAGANTALGVTLAFNTIGWESENVLFSAIDALLGDSLLAGAFSGENPSNATATMLDTTVNASGQLTVSAVSGVTLNATISNTSTASTTTGDEGLGVKGGQDLSLGLVLASNKVLAKRRAPVSTSTPSNLPGHTITTAGGVAVTAQDTAGIVSTVTLGASSTSGVGGNTAMAGAVTLNDVRGGASASIGHTTLAATGGVVLVQAKEMATISATTTSEVAATAPKSSVLTGPSSSKTLAVGGVIGTNLVQSAASAGISSSVVTTSGTGTGGQGDRGGREHARR